MPNMIKQMQMNKATHDKLHADMKAQMKKDCEQCIKNCNCKEQEMEDED